MSWTNCLTPCWFLLLLTREWGGWKVIVWLPQQKDHTLQWLELPVSSILFMDQTIQRDKGQIHSGDLYTWTWMSGMAWRCNSPWDTNTHRRKLPGRRDSHLHRWFCSEWGEIVMGIHCIKLRSHHTGRIRSNRCHCLKHVHGNQSNHWSTELALQ